MLNQGGGRGNIKLFVTLAICLFGFGVIAAPVANANFYTVTTDKTLRVSASGVLANDTPASGLTAVLVSSPSHGTLTLTNNGGFQYVPNSGYMGVDTFTYRAFDGVANSPAAAVTISVTPVGAFFFDDFSRSTNANPTAPWNTHLGIWNISDGLLSGFHTGSQEYIDFWVNMNLTDYRIQGRIQLPQGAWGGGFTGRINPATGAKYFPVIYPEGSQGSGGLPLMRLIKFHTWDTWNGSFTPMAEVPLPSVGTNWHTERLEFRGNRVMVYFDNVLTIDAIDDNVDGLPPLTNGGFGAHMYSEFSYYTTYFDDVVVSALQPVANDDSYTLATGKPFTAPAPGVLANDLTGAGNVYIPQLVSGPAHGTLTLNTNGSFTYTATSNYIGSDSFTYQDTDGFNTSAVATVTISVVPNHAPTANNDSYYYVANTTLDVAATGILTNDFDVDGDSISLALVSGPVYGTLNLSDNGDFTYTPSTNFTGLDQFTYKLNDGAVDSSVATVFLRNQLSTNLFFDSFTHTGTLSPWVLRAGNWDVTGGMLEAGVNSLQTYGNVYLTNNWTNFSVSAKMQFPVGAFGGAVSGRVNTSTGARYSAWVYPENSPGGSNVLKLIKFSTWTAWGYEGVSFTPIAQVNIPPVGTNWHNVKLAFHDGTQIAVYFDDVQYISTSDDEASTYQSGRVSLDMWTQFSQYQMAFEDVVVSPLVNDVSFSTAQNKSLAVTSPGTTANCTEVYGTNLTTVLLTGPTNGALSFSSNGSFVYTPNINLRANDSFTCRINDGLTNLGTARVTIHVTPSILTNQIITFAALTNKVYGDAPFALTASSSSGLPVSFNILSGPATITGSNLIITGAGNVTVRASQSGDITNFNAAPNVDQSFTVNPALLTVTANNLGKTYGTANPSLTANISGFVNGENSGVLSGNPVLSTAAATNSVIGNYPIIATVGTLAAANYSFAFTAGTLTITPGSLTVSATGVSKTYDGTTNAVVMLMDDRFPGDDITTSYTSAGFADKNAGSGKAISVNGISISGAAAGNYNFNTAAIATADIITRPLTLTANGVDKVYDGTTNATVTLSDDRVFGDSIATGFTSAGFADANIGTNKPVAVGGISVIGVDAGNYTFNATTNTTASITARTLTITASGVDRVYDGTTNATVILSDDRVSGDVLTTSYDSAHFADVSVGSGKPVSVTGISIGGVAAGNYIHNTATNTTANIIAKALTITATGVDKIYDGATNATVTLSDDRVSGDVLTTSYSSAHFVDANVGNGKVVVVTGIYISGVASGNYTFNTATNTTASITSKVLTISATGVDKVYDGTTNATVTLSDDRVVGDDLTTSYSSAHFADAAAGNGKAVAVSGISVNGVAAGNYSYITSTNTTANITARSLVITASGVDKIYDGTTNATVTLSDDRVSGDDLTTSYGLAHFADVNVGSGKAVSVIGISLAGSAAGNYSHNIATNTTANITARTLVIAATGVDKIYDGTTNAIVTLSDDRVAGDDLTTSYGLAHFGDANAGNGKPVYVTGISISGAATGNYTFNTATNTTANITARTLTITAIGADKVYDGTTNATVTLSDDRVFGDDLTTGYGSAHFEDANVGNGKMVTVSDISVNGVAAGNYSHNTTTNSTASITARALMITATGVDKVYDGTTNATVTLSDDRVAADILTTSYSSAHFADANIGNGKTVFVTGISISGAAAGNYIHNTATNTTANISARSLVITANGVDKLYDGTTNATVTLSDDRIGGDVLTTSYSSAHFADASVGNGKPVFVTGISISGAAAANYSHNTTTNTTANITAASILVSAHNAARNYGDTNPVFTASYSGFLSGDTTAVISGAPALACPADTNSPVGSYDIVAGIGSLAAANYSFTFTNGTLTVGKALITVAADGATRIYDVTNPLFTASYSGFVNGETTNILSGSPELTTIADTNSPVGSYDIVAAIGTLSATNYNFAFTNNTLTVTHAPSSIVWSNPADIVYGIALGNEQLNAVGSVPGVLDYTPAAGTILDEGADQILSVTLAPSNTNYLGSTTNVLINVLKSATTNFVITSQNPALPGAMITFTSTLSSIAPGAATPTGIVEFMVDGVPVSDVSLTNGVAHFQTASLTHGTHNITAAYAGNNDFGGSTNSLATLEVINRAPATGVYLANTRQNVSIEMNSATLMASASDADGDTITLTNISSASATGGTVAVNGATITYTPAADATGSDSFTYVISDNLGGQTTGLVTIIVSATNAPAFPLGILANGHSVAHFVGTPGQTYTVRASTDLSNWTDLGNVPADANGSVSFEDADAPNFQHRYYRIVPAL